MFFNCSGEESLTFCDSWRVFGFCFFCFVADFNERAFAPVGNENERNPGVEIFWFHSLVSFERHDSRAFHESFLAALRVSADLFWFFCGALLAFVFGCSADCFSEETFEQANNENAASEAMDSLGLVHFVFAKKQQKTFDQRK